MKFLLVLTSSSICLYGLHPLQGAGGEADPGPDGLCSAIDYMKGTGLPFSDQGKDPVGDYADHLRGEFYAIEVLELVIHHTRFIPRIPS